MNNYNRRIFYCVPILLSGIYCTIWIPFFLWNSLRYSVFEQTHLAVRTTEQPIPISPQYVRVESIGKQENMVLENDQHQPFKINLFLGNRSVLWTKADFECISWRETANCDPFSEAIPSLDRSCDDTIRHSASGYCEIRNRTSGEKFSIVLSHCGGANQDFRCGEIGMEFANLKILANAKMRNPEVMPLSSLDSAQRGIVFIAEKQHLLELFVSIQILRYHECQLPIEIWFAHQELSRKNPMIQRLLHLKDVTLRVVREEYISMCLLKIYSIFYSAFDQVLSLTPSIFLQNPTQLFNSSEFLHYGAIFWPHTDTSGKNYHQHSMIWELLDIEYDEHLDLGHHESGTVLFDKRKSKEVLNLLYFYAYHPDIIERLQLQSTSKCYFRLAWMKLKKEYFMIERLPNHSPYFMHNYFCGKGVVHFDNEGQPLLMTIDRASLHSKSHKSLRERWMEYLYTTKNLDSKKEIQDNLDVNETQGSRKEFYWHLLKSPYHCNPRDEHTRNEKKKKLIDEAKYTKLDRQALEYAREGRILAKVKYQDEE